MTGVLHARAWYTLRHRDYRLFWAGQGLSLMGTQMQRVAVAWHVWQLTGSPVALGLIGAARLAAVLVFALPGGVLADRGNRVKLLFRANVLATVASGVLAAVTIAGVDSPAVLYACVIAGSAGAALGAPARQSLLPNLVPPEDLQPAITLSLLTWDIAGVVGPAVGGLVLAQWGPAAVYGIDVVSFIAVLGALALVKDPPVAAPADPVPVLPALKDGFRFVFGHRLILSTMLLDFAATVLGQATVLFPPLADQVFHVGPEGLGIMHSAPALGSVVTGLVMSVLPPPQRHGRWLLGAVALYGAATFTYGALDDFAWVLVVLLVVGGADTVSTVLRQTLRQRLTPDAMRGRMTGVNMLFFNGGPQLGELESGIAASLLGPQRAIMLGGAGVVLLVAMAAAWVPSLRRYRDEPTAPASS